MKNTKPLDVLVIGAGMYVCGRGTDGFGTILPTLYVAQKEGQVGRVGIAATKPKSVKLLKQKIIQLDKLFALNLNADIGPSSGKWDCAIVSVPDHSHFNVTAPLLKKGMHCLVVKPLAPTLAEVKRLIKLQKANGVYGAVEFHKRFDRSNRKLRDTLKQGRIGDPLYFIVEYSQRKSVPIERFKAWVNKTNIFQYLGIHYVDIIYFATGATPIRVAALGQKNYLCSKGIGNYDAVECLAEWRLPSGRAFTSSILTSWVDPEKTTAMSDQKIKVIGTKGRYEADQKRRGITLVTDEQGCEEPNPDFSSFYGSREMGDLSFEGYGPESISRFLADVSQIKAGALKASDLEGKRPTFAASLVPTAVIEAVNRSLKDKGRWVKVKL